MSIHLHQRPRRVRNVTRRRVAHLGHHAPRQGSFPHIRLPGDPMAPRAQHGTARAALQDERVSDGLARVLYGGRDLAHEGDAQDGAYQDEEHEEEEEECRRGEADAEDDLLRGGRGREGHDKTGL